MNVLILSYSYYPDTNGVQQVTQYEAEGLKRLGHNIWVVTNGLEQYASEEVYNGVVIERVRAKTDWMLHFGEKKKYLTLVKALAKKMDVVMCVCPQGWATDWVLSIVEELPCASVMMVHGIHDFRWSNFKDRSLYGLVRKVWGDIRWRPYFFRNWKNIKKFDEVIQLHEQDFATKYFAKHGIRKQEVLYNAVDDDFIEFNGEKIDQIINVGTYSPRKNQLACLQAFYQASLTGWKLVLIGSRKNKYYKKLLKEQEKLEHKFGKRDVEIRVCVTRSETIRYICESKIYLLTSVSEMFPVSLIEGMAAGCAWISTDVGIDRYLPGGVICDRPSQIAKKLEEISSLDAWKVLGEKGRVFARENCQKELQIKRLEAILLEAKRIYQIEGRKV